MAAAGAAARGPPKLALSTLMPPSITIDCLVI
jgi:hypothetical protein